MEQEKQVVPTPNEGGEPTPQSDSEMLKKQLAEKEAELASIQKTPP